MTEVRRLGPSDVIAARHVNDLFATAFADEAYTASRPTDAYLASVLGKPNTIVLAAYSEGRVTGALVAYVLEKLEQERSEIYIYDLAVAEQHRRRGVATQLIRHLQEIGAQYGAWVVYVQADYGDEPAIALYEKLGRREDVMHFDIRPAAIR